MAKKKDLDKANALIGVGDFSSMLSSISATQKTEAPVKEMEEKPVKDETLEADATNLESSSTAEAEPEAKADNKEESKEEGNKEADKKAKKRKSSLDDVLVARKSNNGPTISLVVPLAVRDFLNLLKDMSPENTSMVSILSNIIEDFKNAHREEITERIKKLNEEKLNSF